MTVHKVLCAPRAIKYIKRRVRPISAEPAPISHSTKHPKEVSERAVVWSWLPTGQVPTQAGVITCACTIQPPFAGKSRRQDEVDAPSEIHK